jgi:acyl-CoA thioester hydrolase
MISQCDLTIRVRYAEVDQMGVLHHSRFWVYFEMGRTELLRRSGLSYADLENAGVFFVVAKCSARFLAPARYDDELVLTTRITRVGAARIDHAYELRRAAAAVGVTAPPAAPSPGAPGPAAALPAGLLLATAETTIACVDRQGQLIAIPDNIRIAD